jgi:hypothetical protein
MTTIPKKELRCLYSELRVGNVYTLRPMKGSNFDVFFYLLLRKEEEKNWTRHEFLEMPSGKHKTLTTAKTEIWSDLYLMVIKND